MWPPERRCAHCAHRARILCDACFRSSSVGPRVLRCRPVAGLDGPMLPTGPGHKEQQGGEEATPIPHPTPSRARRPRCLAAVAVSPNCAPHANTGSTPAASMPSRPHGRGGFLFPGMEVAGGEHAGIREAKTASGFEPRSKGATRRAARLPTRRSRIGRRPTADHSRRLHSAGSASCERAVPPKFRIFWPGSFPVLEGRSTPKPTRDGASAGLWRTTGFWTRMGSALAHESRRHPPAGGLSQFACRIALPSLRGRDRLVKSPVPGDEKTTVLAHHEGVGVVLVLPALDSGPGGPEP